MDYSPFGQLIAQYKFTQPGDDTLSRLPLDQFSGKDANFPMNVRLYEWDNKLSPCQDPKSWSMVLTKETTGPKCWCQTQSPDQTYNPLVK